MGGPSSAWSRWRVGDIASLLPGDAPHPFWDLAGSWGTGQLVQSLPPVPGSSGPLPIGVQEQPLRTITLTQSQKEMFHGYIRVHTRRVPSATYPTAYDVPRKTLSILSATHMPRVHPTHFSPVPKALLVTVPPFSPPAFPWVNHELVQLFPSYQTHPPTSAVKMGEIDLRVGQPCGPLAAVLGAF